MSQAGSQVRASRPRLRRASLRAVPKAIERSGNGWFAGVCMTLLGGGLLVLLLLNTALAQGAFTLQQLRTTSGSLADEQHALGQSLEAQSNSAALAQRAAQLGMVPARSMAFLRLSDGVVIGVALPAEPQALVVVTTPRPEPTPTVPTAAPTDTPTTAPTGAATTAPTGAPTTAPTAAATTAPTGAAP